MPRLLAALALLLTAACQLRPSRPTPTIEFTQLPPSGEGSPDKVHDITGRVKNARPGDRIVLFARSGVWWVQPTAREPFTIIRPDATWRAVTHPGINYAAILVTPDYRPPATTNQLPAKSDSVLAVATADPAKLDRPQFKRLDFSGYQWELRQTPSTRGGTKNEYDPANGWTDSQGRLHLRINKTGRSWTSAEVTLTHSLGYGSYKFIVNDVAHLEPAAVFSFFTWDEAGPPREMNLEISRWGETNLKNAQYVIQPYYVPANVVRFMAPPGILTHTLLWEPGRITFKTFRGADPSPNAAPIARHTFSSGVPSPGNEAVHMNLYVYDNKSNPLQNSAEVVVEKFEYLP